MQYTESQLNEFKLEFSKRRGRRLVAFSILIPSFIAVVAFAMPRDDRHWILLLVGLPIALTIFLYDVWNWRCPACNKYFDRINPSYCPFCGIPLE